MFSDMWHISLMIRASKTNFARWIKTALGLRGQTETFLKIEDLSWKYKLIFKKKDQNKTSLATDMGPFRDSRAPSLLSGPQTDIPTELPSNRTSNGSLLKWWHEGGLLFSLSFCLFVFVFCLLFFYLFVCLFCCGFFFIKRKFHGRK